MTNGLYRVPCNDVLFKVEKIGSISLCVVVTISQLRLPKTLKTESISESVLGSLNWDMVSVVGATLKSAVVKMKYLCMGKSNKYLSHQI